MSGPPSTPKRPLHWTEQPFQAHDIPKLFTVEGLTRCDTLSDETASNRLNTAVMVAIMAGGAEANTATQSDIRAWLDGVKKKTDKLLAELGFPSGLSATEEPYQSPELQPYFWHLAKGTHPDDAGGGVAADVANLSAWLGPWSRLAPHYPQEYNRAQSLAGASEADASYPAAEAFGLSSAALGALADIPHYLALLSVLAHRARCATPLGKPGRIIQQMRASISRDLFTLHEDAFTRSLRLKNNASKFDGPSVRWAQGVGRHAEAFLRKVEADRDQVAGWAALFSGDAIGQALREAARRATTG